MLVLQWVLIPYLYGGLPDHVSPTSWASTCGARSCLHIIHDKSKSHPRLVTLLLLFLGGTAAQDGGDGLVALKFAVASTSSFELKPSTASLFLNYKSCAHLLICPEAPAARQTLWRTSGFRNRTVTWTSNRCVTTSLSLSALLPLSNR